MVDIIWQALKHTPPWVYVLFIYLMYRGFRVTRTRVMHIGKLFIMPTLFFILSIEMFITSMEQNTFTVGLLVAAMCFGALLGWVRVFRSDIKVDNKKKKLQLPGSWNTLIIILLVFFSKYYFSYQLSLDPHKIEQTGFEYAMLAVTGICAGMLIGRLANFVYRLKTDPHTPLHK